MVSQSLFEKWLASLRNSLEKWLGSLCNSIEKWSVCFRNKFEKLLYSLHNMAKHNYDIYNIIQTLTNQFSRMLYRLSNLYFFQCQKLA